MELSGTSCRSWLIGVALVLSGFGSADLGLSVTKPSCTGLGGPEYYRDMASSMCRGNWVFSIPLPTAAVAIQKSSMTTTNVNRGFGNGWEISAESRLVLTAGGTSPIYIQYGDGGQVFFDYNATAAGWIPRDIRIADSIIKYVAGDIYEVLDSEGIKAKYTGATGYILSVTDNNSVTTTYGRDPASRIENITTTAFSRAITIQRDPSGNVVSVTDPEGKAYGISVVGGNLAAVTFPGGNAPGGGGIYTVSYHSGTSQVQALKTPDGSSSTFAYAPTGEIVETIDPFGYRTEFRYFSDRVEIYQPFVKTVESFGVIGKPLVTRISANGKTTDFTYDASGRITQMTDHFGVVTKIDLYNDVAVPGSRQVKKTTHLPDNVVTTFNYSDTTTGIQANKKRNLISKIVTSGQYTYREEYSWASQLPNRRLLSSKSINGIVESTFGYNAAGELTQVKDRAGSILYSAIYNANGTLASSTDREGRTTMNTYNPGGFVLETTDPLQLKTTFDTNKIGFTKKIAGPNSLEATFEPDDMFRPKQSVFKIAGQTAQIQENFSFMYGQNGGYTTSTTTKIKNNSGVEETIGNDKANVGKGGTLVSSSALIRNNRPSGTVMVMNNGLWLGDKSAQAAPVPQDAPNCPIDQVPQIPGIPNPEPPTPDSPCVGGVCGPTEPPPPETDPPVPPTDPKDPKDPEDPEDKCSMSLGTVGGGLPGSILAHLLLLTGPIFGMAFSFVRRRKNSAAAKRS